MHSNFILCNHCPYQRKSLNFGYVKHFRRHIKARNLNGSVVCSCARKRINWCLFQILNFHWLSAILESCHQNISKQHIARRRHTILLFFRERKKRIYFTVRILHQKGHPLRENHCVRTSERCPSRSSWTPYHCQVKVSRQICLFKRWFLSTNVTSFETYFPSKRFHIFDEKIFVFLKKYI